MNTTWNESGCSSPFNPTAAKIGETFAYCLVFVVSLLGNSFIAIIVYKTRSLRKPINFFILNMAISDLLSVMLLFPRELTYLFADLWIISGPLEKALCKLVNFAITVSVAVSIQSLILIAVDRFGAVVLPLRSPLISSKRFILGTWIVTLPLAWPYVFAWKVTKYQGQLICRIRWEAATRDSTLLKNYFIAGYIVFFYIPTILLAILYSIIVIKLKSQLIPGEQSAIAEQQRAKRNGNVLKMAIAIVFGFVLCWMPYNIDILLFYFEQDSLPCGFFIFRGITWFMAVSNCAVNPCICFLFSTNYRTALKRLFNCLRGAAQWK